MAFHLAAFTGNFFGATAALTPVADSFLSATTSGFMLPGDMNVVVAYASHADIETAQIQAPSLLRTAYPYIRPVQGDTNPTSDPNVMRMIGHPLRLRAMESVSAVVAAGGAGASQGYVLLWMCKQLERLPPGEKFTLRYAVTAPTNSATWTSIGTVTFDQSLPAGRYAIVGFQHWCAGGIAARLQLPEYAMRPGTLSQTTVDGRTDRTFYEGGLGVYGYFNSFAPPQCEVLSTAGVNTDHEVYLTVIRVGDVSDQGCPPGDGTMAGNPTGAPTR